MIVRVAESGDPCLRDYVGLRDVALRRRLEPEQGLFVAEGELVIRRAVAAGHPVRSFLMAERWLDGLQDLVAASGAPCYVLPPEEVAQIAGFQVHRGALASMARLRLPSVAEVVSGANRVIVLEDIVDHTNVGAIFRSAAALGVDAAVLSPRCADPLYRRAVRVSMGAVFALPYARMSGWYDGLAELRALGFRLLALTPAPDAVPLEEAAAGSGRLGLLLGTEGDGLSSRWMSEADRRVRIPLHAGVDSLNVAAAAAVACYVLARPSTQSPHSPPPGTR